MSDTTNPMIDEIISTSLNSPTDGIETTYNLLLASTNNAIDEPIFNISNSLDNGQIYSQSQSSLSSTILPSLNNNTTPGLLDQVEESVVLKAHNMIGNNILIFLSILVVVLCFIAILVFIIKYIKSKSNSGSYYLVNTNEAEEQVHGINIRLV